MRAAWAVLFLAVLSAGAFASAGTQPAPAPRSSLMASASALCTDLQTESLPGGFAPLELGQQATVDSTGFDCYELFAAPGAPFHGTITVSLQDAFGNEAKADLQCTLAGLADPTGNLPLSGCGALVCNPSCGSLVPGAMSLSATVSDGGLVPGVPQTPSLPVVGSYPVLPFGSWSAGVIIGQS